MQRTFSEKQMVEKKRVRQKYQSLQLFIFEKVHQMPEDIMRKIAEIFVSEFITHREMIQSGLNDLYLTTHFNPTKFKWQHLNYMLKFENTFLLTKIAWCIPKLEFIEMFLCLKLAVKTNSTELLQVLCTKKENVVEVQSIFSGERFMFEFLHDALGENARSAFEWLLAKFEEYNNPQNAAHIHLVYADSFYQKAAFECVSFSNKEFFKLVINSHPLIMDECFETLSYALSVEWTPKTLDFFDFFVDTMEASLSENNKRKQVMDFYKKHVQGCINSGNLALLKYLENKLRLLHTSMANLIGNNTVFHPRDSEVLKYMIANMGTSSVDLSQDAMKNYSRDLNIECINIVKNHSSSEVVFPHKEICAGLMSFFGTFTSNTQSDAKKFQRITEIITASPSITRDPDAVNMIYDCAIHVESEESCKIHFLDELFKAVNCPHNIHGRLFGSAISRGCLNVAKNWLPSHFPNIPFTYTEFDVQEMIARGGPEKDIIEFIKWLHKKYPEQWVNSILYIRQATIHLYTDLLETLIQLAPTPYAECSYLDVFNAARSQFISWKTSDMDKNKLFWFMKNRPGDVGWLLYLVVHSNVDDRVALDLLRFYFEHLSAEDKPSLPHVFQNMLEIVVFQGMIDTFEFMVRNMPNDIVNEYIKQLPAHLVFHRTLALTSYNQTRGNF